MVQYYIKVNDAVLRIRTWTQLEAITGKTFKRNFGLFKCISKAFPKSEVRSHFSAIENGWILDNGEPAGQNRIGYWGSSTYGKPIPGDV